MSLAGKLKELVLRIGERIVRRVQQDVEAGQILVVEHGIQAGLARQARRAHHGRRRRVVGPDGTDPGPGSMDGLVVVLGEGGHFGRVRPLGQVVVFGAEFLLRGERHVCLIGTL